MIEDITDMKLKFKRWGLVDGGGRGKLKGFKGCGGWLMVVIGC